MNDSSDVTLRHAFEHVQEAHEEALDLYLLQFVTPQEATPQGCSRMVLENKDHIQAHRNKYIILSGPFDSYKYGHLIW